jgi:hypothetical protein
VLPNIPTKMTRKSIVICSLFLEVVCFIVIGVHGEKNFPIGKISGGNYHETIHRLQSFRKSLTKHDSIASTTPSSSPSSQPTEVNYSCTTLILWFSPFFYQDKT